ncbi:hypothetical protein DC58_14220 [Vibrio navarrensis]|uniref:antibiotic biosynthesis monooxygenase family protein n=1 Tax=Vibrio navarrensis TaxID=29495 RepID=UPI00052D0687|nr:hypothetical protein [Vibrio navarrensis]KGK21853.1 hypothetical protein DC58_14220 [Vibrio navarrensis]
MEQVIEMVSFKLIEGTSAQTYIAASEQSQAFVASQPGFLYRSLSHDTASDSWTDVVYWQDMEAAKKAGEQSKSHADCQPLMALIEPNSIDMRHQLIKMSSCNS